MSPDRRLRVVLLFGGRSAEHDVSCTSAVAVARALDPKRYEVIPVAISRDGRWLLAAEAQAAIEAERWPPAFPTEGAPVRISESAPARLEGASTAGPVDVVFPLLHGPYGEDGTVQGLLELAGLPYVGSGVLGSAVGMDKVMMKRAFAACGLPTPSHVALRAGTYTPEDVDAAAEGLGYPCFVKPANLGSSVGVSKVHDPSGLRAAAALAQRFDEWVLVEEGIAGREIEVAVLGDLEPQASLPGEIIPGAEFYSYEDKYLDDRAGLVAPAELDAAATAEVRRLAVAAFQACRCEGMARVDFFYEHPGRGWLVNEVNTIPGFTPISMYPKLWEVSGLPYPDLIDRLIELAMERHRRRQERAGRQRE
jgi:D-alanine--D-alanine ligase